MDINEAKDILNEGLDQGEEAFAALLLKGDRTALIALASQEEAIDDAAAFVDALLEAIRPAGDKTTKTAEEIQNEISWRYGDCHYDQVREGLFSWVTVSLALSRCSRDEAEVLVSHWKAKVEGQDVDLVEIPKEQVVPCQDPRDDEGEWYVVRWRDLVWTGRAYVSRDYKVVCFRHPQRGSDEIPLSKVEQVWRVAPR